MKAIVTYVGIQENVAGKADFLLVNEPGGSTVRFDPEKHIILPPRERFCPSPSCCQGCGDSSNAA